MLRYLPMKTVFTVFLIIAGLAFAASARAEIAKFEDSIKPVVVGNADAPVTIIEFASLGCPHCANFHHDTYPQIKKDYIDTGKAKLVFTDFPLGTPALAAAMIARCSGPQRYMGYIDIFFRAQAQWSRADNPLNALKKIARFGGMSNADADACLAQQNLIDHIQSTARKASEEHKINSTPSFLVNGTKVSGAQSYNEFRTVIDAALKKAQ